MTISAPGRFFDGIKASRYAVSVTLRDAMIEMRGPDTELIARWPCAEVAQLSSPQGVIRLGPIPRHGSRVGKCDSRTYLSRCRQVSIPSTFSPSAG